MTFKIGDLQASNFSLSENTQKSESKKLLSNSVAENEAAINYLANTNPQVKVNNLFNDGDDKKTVGDFLRKVTSEQPLDEKASGRKIRIVIDVRKPTAQTSVADYDKATWKAIFQKAGYGMLTDQEMALAVGAMNSVGWKVVDSGFSLTNLRAEDAKPGPMAMTTTQGLVEKAKRAGQAVLQYQEYQANRRDAAIEYGKNYVNGAMGGFVQVPINGGINLINGVSEPLRAGERFLFDTNYIPEVPKLTIAEKSEYWNKDGRMYANKGGEIIATGVFGGILGGKAITTQGGRILLGTESSYNIGAGLFGKDTTQTDAQGNARQMGYLERGFRITGGIFGARQTINTEISTPNSLTNRATDKLDDIFKNTPTFKPQSEFATPEGLRFKGGNITNDLDDVNKIGNTFEMRAKKTLSGIAPDEQVVNALKNEFKPADFQFGKHTFKLDWSGMKHILQRHHPDFWNGSIKKTQSYFDGKIKIAELQETISEILKQNRATLIKRGTTGQYQISGTYNGKDYILGINDGRIGQLYSLPGK